MRCDRRFVEPYSPDRSLSRRSRASSFIHSMNSCITARAGMVEVSPGGKDDGAPDDEHDGQGPARGPRPAGLSLMQTGHQQAPPSALRRSSWRVWRSPFQLVDPLLWRQRPDQRQWRSDPRFYRTVSWIGLLVRRARSSGRAVAWRMSRKLRIVDAHVSVFAGIARQVIGLLSGY